MFIVVAKKKEKGLFKKIMLLSKIRAELINDSIAKDICKENSVDKEFLKGVPITFDDIDVAAKTVDSEIILNTKLIKKPFDVIMRYVIHELVHAIQHCETNGKSSKQDKSEDYLDKETEVEAFQQQIRYESKVNGEESAKEYVDGLLDYHGIDGKRGDKKKEELMEEVD